MLSTLFLLLLTHAPLTAPLEDAPPPLVPFDSAPPVPQLHAVPDGAQGGLSRYGATFAGALLGAAPSIALFLVAANTDPRQGLGALMGVGLALMPVTTALGAFAGHWLAGGRGTLGKAFAGAGIGVGASFLVGYMVFWGTDHQPRTPAQDVTHVATITAISAGAAFAMTAAFLEYSHRRETEALQVTFAPAPGGVALALSGRF